METAHAQNNEKPRVLCMLEGTFSLDAVHGSVSHFCVFFCIQRQPFYPYASEMGIL